MGGYPQIQKRQDFQHRMMFLKLTLSFVLICITTVSAAPREIRSYNQCGASWLKTKCVDCSRNSQQCTEWTLQLCNQCNIGPKAQHNNHNAGDVSPNFGTNFNPGPNRGPGDVSSNSGTNSNGGNNNSGNNNKGNNNGSTNSGNKNSGNKNSGNKNSGNKNSGNGSNNTGDNNGNTIQNSNNTNTIVHFNIGA